MGKARSFGEWCEFWDLLFGPHAKPFEYPPPRPEPPRLTWVHYDRTVCMVQLSDGRIVTREAAEAEGGRER